MIQNQRCDVPEEGRESPRPRKLSWRVREKARPAGSIPRKPKRSPRSGENMP